MPRVLPEKTHSFRTAARALLIAFIRWALLTPSPIPLVPAAQYQSFAFALAIMLTAE